MKVYLVWSHNLLYSLHRTLEQATQWAEGNQYPFRDYKFRIEEWEVLDQ